MGKIWESCRKGRQPEVVENRSETEPTNHH